MITRKGFVGGGAALFGTAFLPTAVCAADEDWKSAFRSVGFDPDAPDASWFAVTSDIHADIRVSTDGRALDVSADPTKLFPEK